MVGSTTEEAAAVKAALNHFAAFCDVFQLRIDLLRAQVVMMEQAKGGDSDARL